MKVFDFIKEVNIRSKERNIDFIEELRNVEASRFIADFQEGFADWNFECLLNNYMNYLVWEDSKFLNHMIEIYDEDELKLYLDDCPDCGAHLKCNHLKTCKISNSSEKWVGLKEYENVYK